MPEDRLEEFARLGADLLGKFKGILYIGDPLKGSFRGVPVRDPLSRFLSSPFIIRVPFFLIHSFNKETPN